MNKDAISSLKAEMKEAEAMAVKNAEDLTSDIRKMMEKNTIILSGIYVYDSIGFFGEKNNKKIYIDLTQMHRDDTYEHNNDMRYIYGVWAKKNGGNLFAIIKDQFLFSISDHGTLRIRVVADDAMDIFKKFNIRIQLKGNDYDKKYEKWKAFKKEVAEATVDDYDILAKARYSNRDYTNVWMSPAGDKYACLQGQHIPLAEVIKNNIFPYEMGDAETLLEDNGWVKCTDSKFYRCAELTEEQEREIKAWEKQTGHKAEIVEAKK